MPTKRMSSPTRVSFKGFIAVLLFSIAANSFAAQTFYGRVLNAQTAGADHNSASVDASSALYGAYQCVWASLTGTINATVTAQVSNDAGTSWDSVSGASMTLTGANGHATVSLSGVLTEVAARLSYAHLGVNGGTIDCYLSLKE